jgi:hypothetical protein
MVKLERMRVGDGDGFVLCQKIKWKMWREAISSSRHPHLFYHDELLCLRPPASPKSSPKTMQQV